MFHLHHVWQDIFLTPQNCCCTIGFKIFGLKEVLTVLTWGTCCFERSKGWLWQTLSAVTHKPHRLPHQCALNNGQSPLSASSCLKGNARRHDSVSRRSAMRSGSNGRTDSRQAMSDRKGCINTSQHPQPLGGAHARLALCAIFQFLQPKAAAFLVPQDLAKKKGTPLQVASSPSVLTFPLMLLTCLKGTT